MPVFLGQHQEDFPLAAGVECKIHAQGVFLSIQDRRQISNYWKSYYLYWRLGFAYPCQALVRILSARKLTLAVAESCTGGGICNAITDIPGASMVLAGGAVIYTPAAKSIILGLNREELPPGCVDAGLTEKMAEKIRGLLRVDLALAVTGALGPESPANHVDVGQIYIALAGFGQSVSGKFNFTGDRHTIKKEAITAAVNALLTYIARWYVA